MHARTLARGDVDAHARAAEYHGALEFLFGDHGAHAQSDAVEHQLRVLRIGIGFDAYVRDRPAFVFQVFLDGLLERITREIRRHQQLLVFDHFHIVHPP